MATDKKEIKQWLKEAKENKDKYLIIVCDTFDWEDYPVFCKTDKECIDEFERLDGNNMQKVMEVYDLSMDINLQLNEFRAKHLPKNN